MTLIVKVPRVAKRGEQRARWKRADSWDLLQALAHLVIPMPRLALHLDLFDLLMQQSQMLEEPIHELAERALELAACILHQFRSALRDVRDALGYNNPEFTQQPADLVGLRGAGLDEALAHPVRREY
ncbi:hypothetical protein [Thiomonas sp. FB-Cd]|uniref:hypothetical protein n=1 Tax=Thiomonas sp. FB-Cd TaxID=1158292 RepID=UPI003510BB46